MAATAESLMDERRAASLSKHYDELTRLVERLHRRFLDVLNLELARLGIEDINAVQALLLTDVDGEVSVRDLKRRAYHIGSSISYNLKKLMECGYVEQERSTHDRRSVRVRPTEAGRRLCGQIREIEDAHARAMFTNEAAEAELEDVCSLLSRVEESWSGYVQMGALRTV